MGNKGAFITMGSDVKPNFTSYDAVVSHVPFNHQTSNNLNLRKYGKFDVPLLNGFGISKKVC